MTGIDLAKRIVILADDEAFTRQTVARLLAGMGATYVVQAEDGEAALAESWTLEAGRVLVISDFNMPRIDGLALLKAVRMGQSGLDRAVPFVMLTAYSDRDLVDVALKLDVSAFLVKPVSRVALEKRLNHLARTEKDTSWLKSIEAYEAVDTAMDDAVLAPPAFESAQPAENKGAPAKVPAKKSNGAPAVGGLKRDPDELAAALARGPSAASDAGAELLKLLMAGDKGEAEPTSADAETQGKFVDRLAASSSDENFAAEVNTGIERLNAELGAGAASGILSALDRLEGEGTLALGDIAGILKTGADKAPPASKPVMTSEWQEVTCLIDDVPDVAVSSQNIFTLDGHMLIAAGTPLNAVAIRLLGELSGRNALDIPADGKSGRPMVRIVAPPAVAAPEPARAPARALPRPAVSKRFTGPERSLDPTEIIAGLMLSRDVHTTSGALYLGAGTKLSERQVGVLENLYETGKLTSKIWVAA